MKRRRHVMIAACGLVLPALSVLSGPAAAQMTITRKPLGGYGASTIARSYGGAGGGGALIPASGGFGGYLPQGSLEASPSEPSVPIPLGIDRTEIGGIGIVRVPIGGESRPRDVGFPAFSARGVTGLLAPIGRRSRPAPLMMPRRLGSPFRPPSMTGGG